MPSALRHLQKGNIAPVDLAQAAIGPGIAVFSRYSKVLETDGSPMGVRTALALINQSLDEVLAEQEGEFDGDTRWAVAWFDQHGFNDGPFGSAEVLCTAKNTSVSGMTEAGIVAARAGKVRLLRKEELQANWDPATDRRFTIWEATHHLVRALEERGEQGVADLIARLGGERAERARDLSYRLYTICERRKWAKDALPIMRWSKRGLKPHASLRKQLFREKRSSKRLSNRTNDQSITEAKAPYKFEPEGDKSITLPLRCLTLRLTSKAMRSNFFP